MTTYKKLMKDYKDFLFCVTRNEMIQLEKDKLRYNKTYDFQLPTGEVINSERRFWEAAIYTFPLDPPKSEARDYVGDALADSLFGGLLGLVVDSNFDVLEVNVIWKFADNVQRHFLTRMVKFFRHVCITIQPESGGDEISRQGINLRLFLICSNEKNKDELASEFWHQLH